MMNTASVVFFITHRVHHMSMSNFFMVSLLVSVNSYWGLLVVCFAYKNRKEKRNHGRNP